MAEDRNAIGPWRRPRWNGALLAGTALLLLLVLIALAAPWLGTVDPLFAGPTSRDRAPLAYGELLGADGESIKHRFVMGSDSSGRDIYSEVVYGTRAALAIGALAAAIALTAGLALGGVAGLVRAVDRLLGPLLEALAAIPALLVALTLVAVRQGTLASLATAVALAAVPGAARLVRTRVRALRDEPYVEAELALGTPLWRVMWRRVSWRAAAPLVARGSRIAATAVLAEAALSFLGVGLAPDIASWGQVMGEGRAHFEAAAYRIFFPALFLTATLLALELIAAGLHDALDRPALEDA